MSIVTMAAGAVAVGAGGFLTYIFGKHAYLGLTQITSGKYSYTYFVRHQKIKKRKFHIPVRNDFRSFFYSFYLNNTPTYNTTNKINFDDIDFGEEKNVVLKKLNKIDSFKAEKFNKLEGLILGSSSKNNGTPADKQYFFLCNKFMLGQVKIRKINIEKLSKVRADIEEQFNIELNEDHKVFLIQNQQGQYIEYINSGFDLSLRYFEKPSGELGERLERLVLERFNKN
jgi:hypothetical protein